MTNTDLNQMYAKFATEAGDRALKHAEEVLQRAANEVARYRERYNEDSTLEEKARLVNAAMSDVVSNILGNVRADLLADAQSKLMVETMRNSNDNDK